MQQEMISNFSQYGKTAVGSAKELLAINGRMLGKMLESQISLAKICVESGEKQIDLSASADSPTDMLSKQTALVEELSGKLADATQASTDIAKEANAEFKVWFEKGLKVADAAVKETRTAATATDVKAKAAPAAKKVAAKPVAKKTPAAKTVAKKSAASSAAKAPVKKAAAPSAKKAPVKKAAAAAPSAKKTPVKKAVAKKAPAKKAAVK